MKTKAYIKQGSYQRSSKKINGALDVNKEVLDTLVDKDVLGTVNCCQYFPTVPLIEVPNPTSIVPEDIPQVPIGGLFRVLTNDFPQSTVFYIRTETGIYIISIVT